MAHESFQTLDTLGPMAATEAGDQNNPARNEYREGRRLLESGEYTQAAVAFHNALKGFEEQGDERGVANASDRLGDACLARGEYAMALANYKRAYAVCAQEDDSFSILALNKKMAAAHRKLGDRASAMELLDDILEHYRLTRNPQGSVETLIVMAEIFKEDGNNAAAADAYRSVSSIHAHFRHDRLAGEFSRLAESLEP